MKAWRRSGGLGPPAAAAPSGYLNAVDATQTDGTNCTIVLDGVSLSTVNDPTGFTVNGAACDNADLQIGDNFLVMTRAAGLNPGDTVAYNGSGLLATIVNPFSLVAAV